MLGKCILTIFDISMCPSRHLHFSTCSPICLTKFFVLDQLTKSTSRCFILDISTCSPICLCKFPILDLCQVRPNSTSRRLDIVPPRESTICLCIFRSLVGLIHVWTSVVATRFRLWCDCVVMCVGGTGSGFYPRIYL